MPSQSEDDQQVPCLAWIFPSQTWAVLKLVRQALYLLSRLSNLLLRNSKNNKFYSYSDFLWSCFQLSSNKTLNIVQVLFVSLKGTDLYDTVLFVLYSCVIYLVYAHLTLQLLIFLVYTEGGQDFSYGVKICVLFRCEIHRGSFN